MRSIFILIMLCNICEESVEEIIATKSVKKVKKNQTSKEENACFVVVVCVCVKS